MNDADEELEEFEEASEEEYLAQAGDTQSELQQDLLNVSCDHGDIMARLDSEKKPTFFLVGFNGRERFAGSLLWSEGVYWEHIGTPPAKIPRRLAKAFRLSVNPSALRFILDKIEAYPMFEKNWGKAGRKINIVTLRRESTYRQGFDWVLDDTEKGLKGEPFLNCETARSVEAEALDREIAGITAEEAHRKWELESVLRALGDRAWADLSPIQEIAGHLNFDPERIVLSFSARRFAGCQGALKRKFINRRWPYASYVPIASSIGPLNKEWFFWESLAMFFRRFPRRLYFRVEQDLAKRGEST